MAGIHQMSGSGKGIRSALSCLGVVAKHEGQRRKEHVRDARPGIAGEQPW
jgi:hypothetical protein